MKKTITQKVNNDGENEPCIISRSITAVILFLKDAI